MRAPGHTLSQLEGDCASLLAAGGAPAHTLGAWCIPSLVPALLAAAPLALPLQLHTPTQQLFCALLKCAYPTACTTRDFPAALAPFARVPAAARALRAIVAVGLLGGYAGCVVRAGAVLRARVHCVFARDDDTPRFSAWCSANASLVRSLVQEHLFELVADVPWVERHFGETCHWAYMRACARGCADDVRRRLNAGGALTEELFRNWHLRACNPEDNISMGFGN